MANILVVDDEKGLRDSIQLVLEKEGHNTRTADDAIKAQQLLNSTSFDIVISDIYMPKITGVELLKSIHNIAPHVKVILITGNPSFDTVTEALRTGAFDYLVKPVSIKKLNQTVNNAIRMKKLEDENRKYKENLELLVQDQTKELRESEERYRLLAENLSDVIWTMNLSLELTYISPSVVNLLGYEQEELKTHFFKTLLPPEGYNKMLKILKTDFNPVHFSPRDADLLSPKILEFEHMTKKGTQIWVEIKINFMVDRTSKPIGILGITREITDRKRIEQELVESEENFRSLAENAVDGIIIALKGGKQVYTNTRATHITGYRKDELLNISIESLLAPEDYMKIMNLYRLQNYEHEAAPRYECMIMKENGQRLPVEFSSTKTIWHGTPADLIFLRDISERFKAEQELKMERDKARRYLDIADVIFLALNKDQEVTMINRKGREILSLKEEDILGKNWVSHFIPEEEQARAKEIYQKFLQGEMEPFYYNESKILVRNGEERIIAWHNVAITDEENNITGILSSGEDITDNMQMEIELRSSERRLNTIINSSADGIIVTDSRGIVLFANPSTEKILGKPIIDIIGTPIGFNMRPNTLSEIEVIPSRQEAPLSVEMSVVDIEWGGKPAFLASLRDITDQKRNQENILKLSQFQQSIINSANAWVYVEDRKGDIILWNKAAEQISGYSSDEVTGHTKIWDWLYPDSAYRVKTQNTIYDRLKEEDIIEKFETTIQTSKKETKIIDWFFRKNLDEKGKLLNIFALGRDITKEKQSEEQLQQSFEKLRKALDGAIRAVVQIMETKDSYTAAHQRRVAEIASAIGREMQLPEDTIEALYVAGSMHDIGKISIPVEILSKPVKLTDAEFAIIKEHALLGFEILKSIQFPWPVAEIVYQHHEACDGSGYPRQLTEEEILLEAKILAVADVLEAISADRPYRPTLGLDFARKVVIEGKGTKYDPEVVEAALKVIPVFKQD